MFGYPQLSKLVVSMLWLSPSLTFAASKQTYIDHALNATDILNSQWYSQEDGLWSHFWWNSGVMLATIGDVALLHDSFKTAAEDIYSNSFTAAKASNPYHAHSWLDKWYDDEGWFALGWIKAYDVTRNTKYLEAAKKIYENLLTGTDATCGGHWWSKAETYNSAIGNELYLAVAASLANRVGDDTSYRHHAQSQADWFLNSDLINENNTINDGLNMTTCKRRGEIWTYNQGAILGALVEMHTLTKNETYLDVACDIARGAIKYFATPHNGILTEQAYPKGISPTGAQFKGVFARNLMYLQKARPKQEFVDFLQTNADSIWEHNRQPDGKLGVFWQGPLRNITSASQSSALDCLLAAATVSS